MAAAESGTAVSEVNPDSDVPDRVGPYHILNVLGEGGMGAVFLAEQVEPIRRRVALKLIKTGADTRHVVTRFEAERQALARMNHPNVARVYEAGTSESGRPYFVMEYVDGPPITEYCDRHRLTLRERLDLFVEVCEGVQHAHQRGIIHRDIKPTNVLVSTEQGRAIPKIIDFGIARATEDELTAESMFTGIGQLIGTPEYMSPEQAEARTLDIDTRTDVYSLGVLLYELMVGSKPFERERRGTAGLSDLCRRIIEEEPPRPSSRAATTDAVATNSARLRRTDRRELVRVLRSDLDWIVLKALAKERTARYGSPQELASDIRRSLRSEPVEARAPSATYRARKFVRRNRLPVLFGAFLGIVLVSVAIVMSAQAFRIARERDRANDEAQAAEQVSEFLVDLFELSDPNEAQGTTVTARQLLDEGAKKIDRELTSQPRTRTRLLHTMGRVYSNLGLYDDAERLLDRARTEQQESAGDGESAELDVMIDLARVYLLDGRNEAARQLLREVIDSARITLGETHPTRLRAMSLLGLVYERQDRPDDAEELLLETLNLSRTSLGVDHPVTATTLVHLADLYANTGRFEDAEASLTELLEVQRVSLGDDHPDTLVTLNTLATVYREWGRNNESESLYLQVLDKRRLVLGEDHPRTRRTMVELAWLYMLAGRYDEAVTLNRKLLDIYREVLGGRHRHTLQILNALANSYRMLGRFDEAEPLFLEALEGQRATLGESARDTRSTMINLSALYVATGRLDDATQLISRVVELNLGTLGRDHPFTLISMNELVVVHTEAGRLAEAERLCQETLETRRRVLGETHERTLESLYNLARLQALQGRPREALTLLREAIRSGFTYFGAPSTIVEDNAWQGLRDDPEFEAIVAELSD